MNIFMINILRGEKLQQNMKFLVLFLRNGKKAYLAYGLNGLKSQTGIAKHPGKGNPYNGLQNKKNKTREEELKGERVSVH